MRKRKDQTEELLKMADKVLETDTSNGPEITVVVGTRHRPDPYRLFIQSLKDTITVPTELIVTDASDDVTYAFDGLENAPYDLASFMVMHEKPRLGTLRGYNQAFRQATGRYVCWFNDDCEFVPGWQQHAIDFMDANPRCGMGCFYWKDDGEEGFHVQTYWQMILANFGCVRREVGEQVGWFDERCGFMYACDNSIALQIIWHDWEILQIPHARILHHRCFDEERKLNLSERVLGHGGQQADAEKFIMVWGHRVNQVQEKYNKFRGKIGPIYVQ